MWLWFALVMVFPAIAADDDGDGFDTPADCDDSDELIHPDAPERCNGVDDNCDDRVDDETAVDRVGYFADADGDGYGDPAFPTHACVQPAGYVEDVTDCDDTNATIHPSATDTCGDGVDSNCDGMGRVTSDEDGDGMTWEEEQTNGTTDCEIDEAPGGDTDGDGNGDASGCDTGGRASVAAFLLAIGLMRRRR